MTDEQHIASAYTGEDFEQGAAHYAVVENIEAGQRAEISDMLRAAAAQARENVALLVRAQNAERRIDGFIDDVKAAEARVAELEKDMRRINRVLEGVDNFTHHDACANGLTAYSITQDALGKYDK